MIAALFTPLLFSLSVIFAGRSAKQVGPLPANLGRLLVATCLLGIWAHYFGSGWTSSVFGWFFLSGCIGFGIGDVALFLAITRIGPRLTILISQCLAAPFAALIEWGWLGTQLSLAQLGAGALVLAGVAVAVTCRHGMAVEGRGGSLAAGIAYGVLAALGQAGGAVITRYAFGLTHGSGEWIDGGSSAFQRILGGLLVSAVFLLAARRWFPTDTGVKPPVSRLTATKWIFLNALAGPALGVACYQWALREEASGVVMAIAATSPVVIIPLAWLMDGDRPTARSVAGGLVAVAGVILLIFVTF
ncbi:EamA family transporter [Verrucomicrobia bacterium LW23]|nr:EamA family transporter [Verrucomicrobia bacterium LW23]